MSDNRDLDADLRATSEEEGGTVAAEAGLLGRLIERAGLFFAAGIVLAALILLYEVFMRYALGDPTLWVHETSIFLCGLAFIFGGLYCAARDSHIRVVPIYDKLPRGPRRVFDVVIFATCALSCLIFAFAAWTMVERAFWAPSGEIRLEGTGSAWNPPTPALLKGFLFIVLIVLFVQFVILALHHLRRARR